MRSMYPMVLAVLAGCTSLAVQAAGGADPAPHAAPGSALTVDQILARHVAARGGAAAWQAVQTMAWTGHIESGPGGATKVPFILLFRRPDSTRFEIISAGQHLVRVFDGHKGWKMRPNNSGIPEVNEYDNDDLSYARDAEGLDGPLFDSRKKGVSVTLAGVDDVEGHPAYHLKIALPSGQVRDDWVDTQSFLELRYDRLSHSAAGRVARVSVYLRDYRTVNGLVLPMTVETGNPASHDSDRMVIEKVAFNPVFTENQFAKPSAPQTRHNGVLVNTLPGGGGVTQ